MRSQQQNQHNTTTYSFRKIHVSVNISNQTLLFFIVIDHFRFVVVNKPNGICARQSATQPLVHTDDHLDLNLLPLLTQFVRGQFKHFPNNKTSPKTLKLVQRQRTFRNVQPKYINIAFRNLDSCLGTLWKIHLWKRCTVESLNKELMYFPPDPHNCFLDVHVWSGLKKG